MYCWWNKFHHPIVVKATTPCYIDNPSLISTLHIPIKMADPLVSSTQDSKLTTLNRKIIEIKKKIQLSGESASSFPRNFEFIRKSPECCAISQDNCPHQRWWFHLLFFNISPPFSLWVAQLSEHSCIQNTQLIQSLTGLHMWRRGSSFTILRNDVRAHFMVFILLIS